MLVRCWATVADGEPALDQHLVNVVFAGNVDKPHCVSRTSAKFQNRIINAA